MDLASALPLALAFVVVLALGFVLGRRTAGRAALDLAAAKHQAELATRDARLADAERQRRELSSELAELRTQADDRGRALAAAQASLEAERQQSAEKLRILQGARDELTLQFKTLAAEVLDDKAKRFTELNSASLAAILSPLQSDLTGFRQKVEEVYLSETRERSALGEQVRLLAELNGTLREETTTLTRALTGDSKTQGDWGEMVLETLLEQAGLIEGEHFTRQATQQNAEGDRVIPDVVLHLPQRRELVIDAKVSLTAYHAYVAAPDAATREARLAEHVASVRAHVKGLSEKRYHELYRLTSVDFVLLFLPVEGALMTALSAQRELFAYAHEKNVLLVSPSTMLFAVRTIAHVWRQEAQSRNAIEIADRGARLYDKFVAFTEDLADVGRHLERATRSYEDARKKLSEGNGNLVTQVQQLEALGVKGKKRLAAGAPTEPVSGAEVG
jgi:DNA recombination protein RmuC